MTTNRIGVFGANGRMGLALLEAATIKEQTQ
ncbi:MAG: 4-hydroxy-tetrahydrodipicolinate reductase, partial [Pseudoalteromonas sp.]